MKEGTKGRLPMALNPKHSKKLRQHFRNNMPRTEVLLWNRIKGKQILGYKIRRQYGVGNYVIDFYCPKLKLGIEIDGDSHFTVEGLNHDRIRNNYIAGKGIELLRVTTTEIYDNMDGVLEYVAREFQKREDRW